MEEYSVERSSMVGGGYFYWVLVRTAGEREGGHGQG